MTPQQRDARAVGSVFAALFAAVLCGVALGYAIQPSPCVDRVTMGPDVPCHVDGYLDRWAPVSRDTAIVACRCRARPRPYAPESPTQEGGL